MAEIHLNSRLKYRNLSRKEEWNFWSFILKGNGYSQLEHKEGGNMRRPSQMEAFQNTLELCALHLLPFTGERFTWAKNTKWNSNSEKIRLGNDK
ncbi:hypothetical protein F8388_013774 [Cannabis sativa]|uniref:Uncharacterized protein n=1 Tax=Cannabis sativa TaxID=3483 RepID=A0A7J6F206_CANSA|nr:hypothetical protein F8388_013774 [Cannabis sativa]